jgi:hypothetical protein
MAIGPQAVPEHRFAGWIKYSDGMSLAHVGGRHLIDGGSQSRSGSAAEPPRLHSARLRNIFKLAAREPAVAAPGSIGPSNARRKRLVIW